MRLGDALESRAGIFIQPGEKSANAAGGQRHAGVGRSVVKANRIPIRVNRLSAWENHAADISAAFIGSFGTEYPGVASLPAYLRLLEIEECHSETIDTARRGLTNAMIEDKPAFRSLNWWRTEADLVGVPPSAAPRFEHNSMAAPMAQVWGIRDPHVRAEGRHWTVNHGPKSPDSPRQQRGIFVFRLHDDAIAFECLEV